MTTVAVRQIPTEVYVLNEDLEMVAAHEDAELEAPCCSGFEGGLPSCGCHGQYGVICPAWDCPDIQDHEIDALIEKLMPEAPDYE